eukprot:TRINITY_DN7029_c0_g1_i2.p1 TRINITY_DN7029_c0_g1~~TRINITY_DN7029_c0_g1_i2.p1  ORF type:complete len:251 (-),score=40.40 TRINITY_DN7029_c0_g1_i2:213-887(-)
MDGNPPANPFSHSVALLLYRIASRMMQAPDEHFTAATVRRLLSNASKLIESERYPHLAGAIHFLMTGVDAVQAQQDAARMQTGRTSRQANVFDEHLASDGVSSPSDNDAHSFSDEQATGSNDAMPMPSSLEHQLDVSLQYLVDGLTFLCNHRDDERCLRLIPAMLSRAATLFCKQLELACSNQQPGLARQCGRSCASGCGCPAGRAANAGGCHGADCWHDRRGA